MREPPTWVNPPVVLGAETELSGFKKKKNTRDDIYQSHEFQRARILVLNDYFRSQDMDIVGSVRAEFAFSPWTPVVLMPGPGAASVGY